MGDEGLKGEVKDYWEQEPCGSGVAQSARYSREYFDEIEENRYRLEPFIHQFAQFTRKRGKKVLEIGVGSGTDHLQFARAGAVLSGIDLTDAAVEMVARRLALEGLSSDLRRSDAENLPFADDTFDCVYSWGVLHHTPDTEKSITEVYRVCKPGGSVCIMLYHRYSLLVLQLWVLHGLLKARPFRSFKDVLVHHMESIGTKAYSRKEASELFHKFRDVTVVPVLTPHDTNRIPGFIAKYIPQSCGWFLVIQAVK
ncbi:MAG TPA: class I SAM-dependent methyltransferase [Nitrospirota bacterium]|nr:class I SAM-dependent methyltransferase [Nitrospirota bacterium]